MLSCMRTFSACGLLAVVCLSTAIAPAHADDHFPSNEDLRHVRSMAQPRLSPDGRSVLIQITDATADGAKSHIWLVDVQQNTARQLTWTPASEKRGESSAEWMPDGTSVLFLAHRGEHTQLFQLPMNGGEAHPFEVKITPPVDESKEPGAIPPATAPATPPVTPAKVDPIECDVERYFIAPDGKNIAILVRDPETPGEKKEHDDKADAVWVDHNPHGSRLYLLDPANGKITPVAVPPDVENVAWTRQSDRLLAIAEGMNNAGDLAPAATAWTVPLSDLAHPAQLKPIPATVGSASWSEDATHIDFLAQSQADAPPGYEDLYEFTVADGSLHNLSDGFTGSIEHTLPIADGGGVLEGVSTGVHSSFMRFARDRREPLQFGTSTVTQLGTNAKHTGWVWMGSSGNQPPALFYAEKLGGGARTLNTPSLLPGAWTEIAPQLVTWKSDSFTIEGLLYLPPQAAQGKVPLVVDVHGGPTGSFLDGWNALNGFLLGQGWAILRANPRGSTGYGAAFAAANKNDLGGGDYRDIMAGVDAVLAKYPLDANRMALMGYSYGGEMAGFVEGQTDRFKAIVSGAPVIDQESEYGTESGSWYDRWFYNGYPWEHALDAWRQSPLANAAKAKTPFMLLQGESDRTDPLGQSQEMYRALRQMGVPVEMVQYPREDHGPLAGGIFGAPTPEPWHGFDGRQRIVTFLDKAFGK
jgi:dipeptidyl aminopeptidase/acylaminoacyl peptidase